VRGAQEGLQPVRGVAVGRVATWVGRLLLLLGLLVFGVLTFGFAVATVTEARGNNAGTLEGLPPIYVITGILVPFCAVMAFGCWWALVDSFRNGD